MRGAAALQVVGVVGGHDFDLEQRPGRGTRCEEHVGKGERALTGVGVAGVVTFAGAEQGSDGGVGPDDFGAVRAPVVGQFFGGAAQHALEPAAGQIRQAVGVEEGEAVFQRMFVAEPGGERGGEHGGVDQGVLGVGLRMRQLAGNEGGGGFAAVRGQVAFVGQGAQGVGLSLVGDAKVGRPAIEVEAEAVAGWAVLEVAWGVALGVMAKVVGQGSGHVGLLKARRRTGGSSAGSAGLRRWPDGIARGWP